MGRGVSFSVDSGVWMAGNRGDEYISWWVYMSQKRTWLGFGERSSY
jgi:hypothetical protein